MLWEIFGAEVLPSFLPGTSVYYIWSTCKPQSIFHSISHFWWPRFCAFLPLTLCLKSCLTPFLSYLLTWQMHMLVISRSRSVCLPFHSQVQQKEAHWEAHQRHLTSCPAYQQHAALCIAFLLREIIIWYFFLSSHHFTLTYSSLSAVCLLLKNNPSDTKRISSFSHNQHLSSLFSLFQLIRYLFIFWRPIPPFVN